MNTAKLIFLTGPSGSGKSTTAKEVASNWPTKCALLDFDYVRTLIKSGYAEPANGWNDETEKQWDIAKQVVTTIARKYIDNNVSVVIEAFATPHDYPTWQKLFGDIKPATFVLIPNLEVVLVRNNQRQGIAKLKESDIKQNYEWSESWAKISDGTIIDNSTITTKQTAEKIIKASK